MRITHSKDITLMRTSNIEKWRNDIFQHIPVSIWIEDLSKVRKALDHVIYRGIHDFRRYFAEHPEEVLSLVKKVRVLKVNEATLQLFQADSADVLLRALHKVFDKETYDVFREELIALSGGKNEFSAETIIKTLNGEKKYVQVRLKVAPGCEKDWSRVYVAINDISALRQRETNLNVSETKYRKIFEYAADAILLVDGETGIIVCANRMAEQLTGKCTKDIVGMHHTQLHPKGEETFYGEIFQKCVQTGICISENLSVCHGSGEKVPVTISSYSIVTNEEMLIVVSIRKMTSTEKVKNDVLSTNKDFSAYIAPQKITSRECDVIRLIAQGFTNGQVAENLCISKKTVETHRSRIMYKLDIHKVTDLVRYAMTSGLIGTDPVKKQ
jgi:PAS domain S-box-containing protein